MKNLIKDIFINHSFSVTEFDFGDLFIKISDENIKYYWLVVVKEDLPSILAYQDEWFETCQIKVQDKDFNKNASLLILTQLVNANEQKKEVLAIEENPYQFKKLVLLYKDSALSDLLQNSEGGKPGIISNLLVKEEIFQSYKRNLSSYDWHTLLYHIAHKLPFLEINVEVNQNLENLFKKSEENLSNSDLLEFYNDIDQKFDENILVDLGNKNLNELIELLSKQN
jgi:hypothetical protein